MTQFLWEVKIQLVFLVKWVNSLSHVQLFATPWIVAHEAPLSMEFSRQEYWSGLPFPSPEDLPNPGCVFRWCHFVLFRYQSLIMDKLYNILYPSNINRNLITLVKRNDDIFGKNEYKLVNVKLFFNILW